MRFLHILKGVFMKKGKMTKAFSRVLSVFMILLMGVTVFNLKTVYSEGETQLIELQENNSEKLGFDGSNYVSVDDASAGVYKILESSTEYDDRNTMSSDYDMELNKVYQVVYPDALTLVDGTKRTVRVSVQLLQDSTYSGSDPSFSKVLIYKGSKADYFNRVRIYWREAQDAKVKWTIELFKDAACTQKNDKYVLTGLEDPDESDYYFDTTGKTIFYKQPKDYSTKNDSILDTSHGYQLVQGTNGGLIRTGATPGTSPDGYNEALFLVDMYDKFEFTTRTYRNGMITVPFFYALSYKVIYDANSPTGSYTGNTPTQNNQFGEPNKIANNGYAVDGYKFVGWNMKANNTGKAFAEGDDYNVKEADDANNTFNTAIPAGGSVTIYAQWTPVYTLRFNANYEPDAKDTSGSMSNITPIEYGEQKNLTKNAFSTSNYRFVGWNTKPDGSGKSFSDEDAFKSSSFGLTDNPSEGVPGVVVDVYGQWVPIYNVKYDMNLPSDGTPASDNKQVDPQNQLDFGPTQTMNKNTFTSNEYRWVGWNTKPDGSGIDFDDLDKYNETSFDTTVNPGDTVTLYAKWELWTHKIHYDAGGGEGTMKTQEFTYKDKEMVSKPNEFWKDGHKFAGFLYKDEVTGTETIYYDIYDFADILIGLGKGSEITLIALWEKLPEITAPYTPPVTGIR